MQCTYYYSMVSVRAHAKRLDFSPVVCTFKKSAYSHRPFIPVARLFPRVQTVMCFFFFFKRPKRIALINVVDARALS
jgi:hypothetical protein